jgi:hypothetical protein
MQIARMMGTSTASALEAVYGDEGRKQKEARQNSVFPGQRDSISISPEAMQAYQMMRLNLQDKPSLDGLNQDEIELLGKVAHEGPMPGGASGSGGSSIISELEAKIKELQQQMAQVQNSGIPDESKAAMTASIEAQIQQAMQELNALRVKTA